MKVPDTFRGVTEILKGFLNGLNRFGMIKFSRLLLPQTQSKVILSKVIGDTYLHEPSPS